MTENQIFALAYAVMTLLGAIVAVGLGLLGASEQLFVFAGLVLLCLGSLVVAQFPPWYESRRRDR